MTGREFRKKYLRRIVIIALVVIAAVDFGIPRGGQANYTDKYKGYTFKAVTSAGRENTYEEYLQDHAGDQSANATVDVDILNFDPSSTGTSIVQNYQGEPQAVMTQEESTAVWTVNVPKTGFYNIYMEYFPAPGRGINIERSFMINGKTPFAGSDELTFYRVWGDGPGGVKKDNQGNEIRPTQIEKPRWESSYFKDYMGYTTDPYRYYFQAGPNQISLTGINEPVVIRRLVLTDVGDAPTYANYIKSFNQSNYQAVQASDPKFTEKIQGEDSDARSDPSLYAQFDRSSGDTDPPSVAKITLNMIGGNAWRVPGQWIEWQFTVPADGMYRISIKARQNYNRGFVSNRSIYIDGQIPCAEASAVPFRYSNNWILTTLQDKSGKDLLFPLKKGTHTIRMEVTLGALGSLLNTMEDSVYELNSIYRHILVLTGPNPDPFRDYRVDYVYPDQMKDMANQSKVLYKLVDDLTNYAGERSSETAAALTLARQLELLVDRPDKIPQTLTNFKSNISALGDSLNSLSQSQLDVDYIVVSTENSKLPKVHETFLGSAGHEMASFGASFTTDYNNLGDVYKGSDTLDVWMLSGRDQSTILKGMIDDTFTPKTGIRVNLRLVAQASVMPAVVAGMGPDVALTMVQSDPVNYALRKAAVDLTTVPDFNEVAKRFQPSTFVPFRFDLKGDGKHIGVYALPETQSFNIMFYRTDIMNELGIKAPNTWDDLIAELPVIQKANMNVGLPSVATTQDFSAFLALMYQHHGTLYDAKGERTNLDTETGVESFDEYTKFYTQYGLPTDYDFVNRLRTGEIPLGFADFSTFNTLEVFAPEIRGLWSFGLMPGTVMPDGTIDRSVTTGSTAAMIFPASKMKEQAWTFIKWWTEADTQTRFCREIESVLGAAGRNPTSNLEAFKTLSWSSAQMKVLEAQRQWTVGTPEVAGGSFVTRHIVNAVRKVLNDGQDTRETCLDYAKTIDDEITKKRLEFGLPVEAGATQDVFYIPTTDASVNNDGGSSK
jgi:ABC-type glycerol-3-phosphate transport system substrate-binding protein